MTIRLTDAQSMLYLDGGWDAYAIEETIFEDLQRRDVCEPVAVMLSDGCVAFYVTKPGVIV